MIKAILVDADGMTLNGEMFSVHLEREFNISRESVSEFFIKEYPAIAVGKADLKERIEPYLKRWGWRGSVDDILAYWFQKEDVVNQELIEYLQELRMEKIPVYLATNQEKYRIAYMKDAMQFDRYFDNVFASCDVGYRKPDPHFYQAILRILKLEPDEIIVWDDELRNIEAATQIGLVAKQYRTFSDFRQIMEKILDK